MTLLHAADEGSKTTTEDTRSIFLQPRIDSLNVWVCGKCHFLLHDITLNVKH